MFCCDMGAVTYLSCVLNFVEHGVFVSGLCFFGRIIELPNFLCGCGSDTFFVCGHKEAMLSFY